MYYCYEQFPKPVDVPFFYGMIRIGPLAIAGTTRSIMRHEDGTFDTPLWGDKDGIVVGFMEQVEWDYEIGGDRLGTIVYPDPEAVPGHKGCGLVEVEVKLRRVIEKADFSKGNSRTPAEVKKRLKKLTDDPEYREYLRLRDKFDHRWKHYRKLREK